MRITAETILVRDEEPAAAEIDGDAVVLSLRAGAYFGFNKVATEIWGMLCEPRSVHQIFQLLALRHQVGEDTLARDVTPFLNTLLRHRLIRVVPPDARG